MSKTTITYVPLDGNGQPTGEPVDLTDVLDVQPFAEPIYLTIAAQVEQVLDSLSLERAAAKLDDFHAGPNLFIGDLFQVQDIDQTWHTAAVGPGVLCHANRDVSVQTIQWDYGTDRVDCPEPACRNALGRL